MGILYQNADQHGAPQGRPRLSLDPRTDGDHLLLLRIPEVV